MVKLIGYENFISKKGNNCTTIHVVAPITKREAHTEFAGQLATSYFLPEHLKDKVSVNDIGKDITIYTSFSAGREILLDILN